MQLNCPTPYMINEAKVQATQAGLNGHVMLLDTILHDVSTLRNTCLKNRDVQEKIKSLDKDFNKLKQEILKSLSKKQPPKGI